MSEQWPKSFVYYDDPSDVITFANATAIARCKDKAKWTYLEVLKYSCAWIPVGTAPPVPKQPDRITALETFHATVLAATQTESNARLPLAIFAADKELRRVINEAK